MSNAGDTGKDNDNKDYGINKGGCDDDDSGRDSERTRRA
jgi:hypothetical protein